MPPQNVQNANHPRPNSLEFDWLTDFCSKFEKSQLDSNSSSAVKMVVRTRSHGNHSKSPATTPVAGGANERHVHPRQLSKMSAKD